LGIQGEFLEMMMMMMNDDEDDDGYQWLLYNGYIMVINGY
jgi:hypothetical protein